jgi:hypothetical protein
MQGYVEGCERCRIFKEGEEKRAIQKQGSAPYGSMVIPWVVFESNPKAVATHYIFTTPQHHLGPEESEARAVLMVAATITAASLLGRNHRMEVSSGYAAAEEHFHVHLKRRGPEERFPSLVRNQQAVIYGLRQEFSYVDSGVLDAIIDHLDRSILQRG